MPLWSSVREFDAQSTPSLARVRAPGERVPARRLALSASFRMPCGGVFLGSITGRGRVAHVISSICMCSTLGDSPVAAQTEFYFRKPPGYRRGQVCVVGKNRRVETPRRGIIPPARVSAASTYLDQCRDGEKKGRPKPRPQFQLTGWPCLRLRTNNWPARAIIILPIL